MTTELQNKAWSVLPKEFKEEVKKEYRKGYVCETLAMLITLFGHHNLTSDAEGEEMLTVPRKKVLEKWQRAYEQEAKYSRAQDTPVAREEMYYNRGIMAIIDTLFGPKCLPDNVDSSEVNVDSLEPKPAEPKYHKGEKVRYNGYVYEVEGLVGKNRYALKGLNFDLDEDMIEPYTEPTKETSPNVNYSDINIDELVAKGYVYDPAKGFDNILKDSFRSHNRLQIAAQIAQGALSNPNVTKSCADFETNQEYIAKTALMYADALIAESEKGGPDGQG